MNKQQQIEEFLNQPVQEGNLVYVRGLGRQNKNEWGNTTKVLSVEENGDIYIKEHNSTRLVKKEDYKKSTLHIGKNPFEIKPFQYKIRVLNFDIGCVLSSAGFNRNQKTFKHEVFGDVLVPEMNDNPHVINKHGERVYYQRGLVWSLEQKQALIHSIYQGIEIGKIVVRERSFQYVENEVKLGNKVGFKDIVDGKQRLNALLDFVMDKFPDEYGNYFSELSDSAQYKFFDSLNITYCELSEDVCDKDVIDMFLNINIAGVKIDETHIEFVKSINI